MLDITVCYSPKDSDTAAEIAVRLESAAEAKVWLEPLKYGETLPDIWDRGLASAGLVLVLSPDSVPARAGRDAWKDVLAHVEGNDEPPVAAVIARRCVCPPILTRKDAFDFERDAPTALRALSRWAVSLHPETQDTAFTPAKLSLNPRPAAMDELTRLLVDGSGTVVLSGSESSRVAQEFAHGARAWFREVIWIGCGGRSLTWIIGEIADRLGISLTRQPESAADHVAAVLNRHRLLVVLDSVQDEIPVTASREGCASMIVTTSSAPHAPDLPVIQLHGMASEPAPALDESEMRLWEAMCVCRIQVVPIELASGIAELSPETAYEECKTLLSSGIVDPLDSENGLYRIRRSTEISEPARRRHAELVSIAFSRWSANPAVARRYLPEFESAFSWAEAGDWPLAAKIGQAVFSYLKGRDRTVEAIHVLELLLNAANRHADKDVIDTTTHELSWLRDFTGSDEWIPRKPVSASEQLALAFDSALPRL